jgi:hypothetical protein
MPHPPNIFGNYKMYLLGDTFLRNFYSVYDYDNMSVKMAINIHAKDIVRIVQRKV